MPQGVYIESPDNASHRAKPNADGSFNVDVLNPVSTVTANAGTGTFNVKAVPPGPGDVVGASLASTGVLYTVPAGRVFRGSLSLSGSVTLAGANQPTISVSGTGALPQGVVHRLMLVGLALTALANESTIGDVHIYGGPSGATVTFTAGAVGSSSGSITGVLL